MLDNATLSPGYHSRHPVAASRSKDGSEGRTQRYPAESERSRRGQPPMVDQYNLFEIVLWCVLGLACGAAFASHQPSATLAGLSVVSGIRGLRLGRVTDGSLVAPLVAADLEGRLRVGLVGHGLAGLASEVRRSTLKKDALSPASPSGQSALAAAAQPGYIVGGVEFTPGRRAFGGPVGLQAYLAAPSQRLTDREQR